MISNSNPSQLEDHWMPLLASESSDCDLVMHLLLAARHVETFLCEPQGSPNDFNRLMMKATRRVSKSSSRILLCKGWKVTVPRTDLSHLDQLWGPSHQNLRPALVIQTSHPEGELRISWRPPKMSGAHLTRQRN